MTHQPLGMIILLWIAAGAALLLAQAAWRRRPTQGMTPFAVLMLAAAIWSAGYALELSSTTLQTQIGWAKVQYLGICAIPAAWFLSVLGYTGAIEQVRHPRRLLLSILIEPIFTLMLVWAYDRSRLMWQDVHLQTLGRWTVAHFQRGSWFGIHTAYSYVMLIAGAMLVLHHIVRRRIRIYRGQGMALMVAMIVPWLFNVGYIARLTPWSFFDFTPFGFVVAGGAVAFGVLRFQLLNITPIARDRVVESMRDAVIVLDGEGRVLDMNRAARATLRLTESWALGRPAVEVLPGIPGLERIAENIVHLRAELVWHGGHFQAALGQESAAGDVAKNDRYFDVRVSPIVHSAGVRTTGLLGHLILMSDVTQRVLAQQVLRRHEADLEHQVKTRTAELEAANRRLRDEIAERERVEQDLAARAQELAMLLAVGRSVSASLSLPEVVDEALKAVALVCEADLSVIYLSDDDGLHYVGAWSDGLDPVAHDVPAPCDGCLCGQAAALARPVFSENIHTDARCGLEACKRAGLRSLAALPLVQGQDVLGVLGLGTRAARDFADQAPFLEATAMEVAAGLRNALLYRQVQARAAELSREVAERERAEQALATYRDQLEAMVAERTQELHNSEVRYRTLVETSPDAIVLVDRSGRIVACNREAAHLHGFANAEALIGTAGQVCLTPEAMELFTGAIAALGAKQPLTIGRQQRFTFRRRDGSTFPVEVSAAGVENADGEVVGVMAIYRDVTERVAAQQALEAALGQLELRVRERTAELEASTEALRESQAQLMEAQRLARLGHWLWEIDGDYLVWSDEVFRIFGYAPGGLDVTYEAFLQAVHPDDREAVLTTTAKALHSDQAYGIDHRIVLPDGSERVVHEQAVVEVDEDGRGWMRGTVQDITERKQAERALYDQNQRLATLNVVAAILSQELDLPRALQATLLKVLELPGLTAAWLQMVPEASPAGIALLCAGASDARAAALMDMHADEVAQVLQTRERRLAHLGGDGELLLVPVQARESVLGVLAALGSTAPGELEGSLSLLESIGHQIGLAVENVQLLEQASQIDVWQELDRLRSELIANVSHEVRTPLGLIKLLASTLLLEEVSLPPEEQREFLLGIQEETDHLERIVTDLLSLGRSESGRLRLEKQLVDLQQLTVNVIGTMRLEIRGHRLARSFTDHPLAVYADPHRLSQILRNLISNAVKYTPARATITVRAYEDEEQVGICIEDEGIGIPFEEQERIFERFYRVDNEVTRRTRGAGLGLAISKAIIELHGGRIWFESVPARGSTFCIGLPPAPAEPEDTV